VSLKKKEVIRGMAYEKKKEGKEKHAKLKLIDAYSRKSIGPISRYGRKLYFNCLLCKILLL